MDDNIEQSEDDNSSDGTNNDNMIKICKMINAHYNRNNMNIRVLMPFQFTDGSTIEFYDENNKILASSRLRLRNIMHIDRKSGQLLIPAYISDINYARDSVDISFGATNN